MAWRRDGAHDQRVAVRRALSRTKSAPMLPPAAGLVLHGHRLAEGFLQPGCDQTGAENLPARRGRTGTTRWIDLYGPGRAPTRRRTAHGGEDSPPHGGATRLRGEGLVALLADRG